MHKLIVLQSLWTFEDLDAPPCPPTLEARLDLIKAAGFDGAGTLWLDREEAKRVASLAAERGLLLEGMALPGSIDALKPALEWGTEFGLHHLNVQPDFRTGSLAKGVAMGLFGLWVIGSTAYHAVTGIVPAAEVMGPVALLALAANVTVALLLFRYRSGDANVRSVWLCSRNDALGNLAVVTAASGVIATGTAWPDLLVATIMASLFLCSATSIVRQALGELAARRLAPGL